MPTQETETQSNGLGAAAKQVAERASSLVRLELELASLEIKQKLGALGLGIGLGVGAAVVGMRRSQLTAISGAPPVTKWKSFHIGALVQQRPGPILANSPRRVAGTP
jgi:hypothetical protein